MSTIASRPPSRAASWIGSPILRTKNLSGSSSQQELSAIARPPSALKRRPSAKDEELRERRERERQQERESGGVSEKQNGRQDPVARLKLLVVSSIVLFFLLP